MSPPYPVADTSPISFLLRIGRTDLLAALFGTVIIPQAVADELDRGRATFGEWRSRLPFIEIRPVSPSPVLTLLDSALDPGEAQSIALAVEEKTLLIIDERAGHREAVKLKVPVMGTVRLLLEAKRRGIIQTVRPLLDELRTRGGLWLSEQVYRQALSAVGEG